MSLVEHSLSFGGSIAHSVDLNTGEIITPGRVPPACPPGREEAGQPDGTQADGMGLSTCHNSPQIIAYKGASFLKVTKGKREKADLLSDELDENKSKRGKISGFSKKSRLRLMRELSKLERERPAVFITLTYPAEWPDSPREWKRHLDNFIKRFVRKYPTAAGVWKLEPQKRGAPHYHLLVWGLDEIIKNPLVLASLILFVSSAWYKVVGSGLEVHLRAGTRVEIVKSHNGVNAYISKYFGKEVADDWGYAGRWWGVFQRGNLPYGEILNVQISQEKAQEIIRYMRRFARIRSRDYKSLTISCNADFWCSRLL